MKFLNPNGPVFAFFNRVGDLIVLNLLYILCSIPFFTAGASVTALYYVLLRMRRKQEVQVVKDFFHSFRQNLKQATALHLLLTVIAIILALDLYVLWELMEYDTFSKIILGVLAVLSVWFLSNCLYAFPLLAHFNNTIRGILKNARFMSLKHFAYTIAMLLVNAAPWIAGLYVPYLLEWVLFIYLFIGFSGIAYFNSRYFVTIFDQYISNRE